MICSVWTPRGVAATVNYVRRPGRKHVHGRAVRRRTGCQRTVGGSVGWSYDRQRRRRRRQKGRESTETAQSLNWHFFWFYRSQPLHLWSLLGRWRRKVNCEYTRCARFHSRNEWIVYCLISGGSYKYNVQCWEDTKSAGVENAALENAVLENMGIKNMASVEWLDLFWENPRVGCGERLRHRHWRRGLGRGLAPPQPKFFRWYYHLVVSVGVKIL